MIKSLLLNKSGLWVVQPAALNTLIPVVFNDVQMSTEQLKTLVDQESESPKVDSAGIVVIKISGMIVAGALPWQERVYNLCNPHRVRSEINAAIRNEEVKGVLLVVDSPGGYSKGVNTLAVTIRKAREVKPVVTYCEGVMCSAAVWIGSAASKGVAEPTAEIGSIGAYLTHYDYSVMLANAGITAKIVKAGKEKAVGNPVEPLSKDDEAVLQKRISNCNTLFISAVAENLGVSAEKVETEMGEGRVFSAQEAEEVGLIDGVGQVEVAFSLLQKLISEKIEVSDMKIEDIKLEDLEKGNPGLLDAIRATAQTTAGGGTFALAAKITAIAGPDAGAKVAELETKGISAEQVVEVFDTFGITTIATPAAASEEEKKTVKTDGKDPLASAQDLILTIAERLQGAPIGAQQPKKKTEVTGDNYMEVAEAMAKEKGISVSAAQALIDEEYPEARQAFMDNANKK